MNNKGRIYKTDHKNHHRYIFKFPKFKAVSRTYGNGLWSDRERLIRHNRADIVLYDELHLSEFESCKFKYLSFAEMRVYFTKKDWQVEEHGLIYTDRNWIKDFRKELKNMGYSEKAIKKVDYSEAGMQGDNYVSLDVEKCFLKETSKIFY